MVKIPEEITDKVKASLIYDNPPDTIYHYCSAQSFFEIIQSKSLWFSNMNMSNDEFEQISIYELLNEVIAEFHDEKDLLHQIELDASSDLETAYVACFSLSHSLLSLWREYADSGKGFCIGFNLKCFHAKPLDLIYIDNFTPVFHSRILYDSEDVRNHIKSILVSALHEKKISSTDEVIQKASYRLKRIGMITKKKHFEVEEEFRLLYVPFPSNSEPRLNPDVSGSIESRMEFSNRKGIIKSHYSRYIKQYFEGEPIIPIKSIHLGYHNNQDKGELNRFLKNHKFDFEEISIEKSTINL